MTHEHVALFVVSALCASSGVLGCATANQDDSPPAVTEKSGEADATPAEPPATEQPVAEQPPADPTSLTVSGALTYTELPRTKSVEAYMGREFTLVDAAGTEHNLKPSDTVSHEQLVGRSGQTVEVTCTPFAEQQPNPHEQAPQGAPGQGAMPRPAGCTVTALSPAP
ncbi:hypothetical protein [Enhygromyxa salina]|uniref:Uncharacterized protein n=1 Tax=Enhygromyxa salina TaxID=215803 RepID=A0A2S9Y7V9_9BACT|nr:hypothetical protein [Enhygromyxa salina]PRQ01187.1 hypothetical protein ENSA7_57920 [Enhygromyxa salina]